MSYRSLRNLSVCLLVASYIVGTQPVAASDSAAADTADARAYADYWGVDLGTVNAQLSLQLNAAATLRPPWPSGEGRCEVARNAKWSPLAIVVTATSLVAACAAASSSTLGLPTHRDLNGYPAALLVATLVRDGQCLYADAEGGLGRWLPIWPAGFILRGDSLMDHETQVAKVGDRVNLGGGEYHPSQYDFVRTLLATDIPAGCRDGAYWLVGEVARGEGVNP